MKLFSRTFEETLKIGEQIASSLRGGDVLALNGPLGAGKTALAKGIAWGLGIQEELASPSYTLVLEYKGRLPLYHMDMYRLTSEEEFETLGADELFYGKGICLVEWGERIPSYLPPNCKSVRIHIEEDLRRAITLGGIEL